MIDTIHRVDVCIVGGGPAGMVLGLLLAHQGVKVLVLERHKNFDREYRGEVLMPRFTQIFRQLGLFEFIEKYPHLKLNHLEFIFRNYPLAKIQISKIAPEAPFAIWMPQPILLGALHDKAKECPTFDLWFNASCHDLIWEGDQVVGVVVEKDNRPVEVRAKIVVGTDGRASTVRHAGGFEFEYEDYDFDVIWFTIPRPAEYEQTVRFFLSPGTGHNYLILPKYPDLLQCGIIVRKGGMQHYKDKGIDSLKAELLKAYPILHSFARGLRDFGPFNVLQARVSFVKRWAKNGCLLVGDSAHTCSPAGAVGVAVAVASAAVAADVILKALRSGNVSEDFLDQVQNILGQDVRKIQKLQNFFTENIISTWPVMSWLMPLAFAFLSKTPIIRYFQRKLMVLEKPLPIDPTLRF